MKVSTLLVSGLLAVSAWLLPGTAPAGQVIMDSAGFISGTQSFVDTFDLPTAGTLTVTLTDIGWPGNLQDLGAFVSSSAGVVMSNFGPGNDSAAVGPGQVAVHWYGTGAGALQSGLYGLEIQFQPGVVSAVPLPASLVVFASGLLLLAFLGRRRSAWQASH